MSLNPNSGDPNFDHIPQPERCRWCRAKRPDDWEEQGWREDGRVELEPLYACPSCLAEHAEPDEPGEYGGSAEPSVEEVQAWQRLKR